MLSQFTIFLLISHADVSVEDYKMPFEEEVGMHPSIEDMQDKVVEKKLRPKIREEWKRDIVRYIFFFYFVCPNILPQKMSASII